MRTMFGALLIVSLSMDPRSASAGDETLAHAKDLYASAAYDEALAVLDALQESAPGDARSIAEYRVFCLLALDRRDEARKHIEAMLHENPQYVPSADETSPRIQSVIREVRRQSLPKIVMERYATAKASFERKDPEATQQFEAVLALLDDPDVEGAVALNDLRTVVTAFRDLTKAMSAQTVSPTMARPLDAGGPKSPAPTPAVDPQPSDSPRIYTSADSDVAPPIAQAQRIPPWIPTARAIAAQEFHGTLELLIDETGAVMSSAMRTSAHPTYNQLLLRATREWKFTPARRQGVPVRYLKIVEIHLKPPA